jgi:hypothetical protein
MKCVLLAAAAALAMAGCMPSGPSPEAVASQNKAYAECQARSKTTVELFSCQNVVYDRYSRPYDRDQDIVTLVQARKLAIAEKVDRGQTTRAEAAAEVAAVVAEGHSESQRRTAEADAADAAIFAATAPAPQPSYVPAQPSGFVPPVGSYTYVPPPSYQGYQGYSGYAGYSGYTNGSVYQRVQ